MARDDPSHDGTGYAPFGLRAKEAARYVGYSESTFHERVKAGTFPRPVRDRGVAVWLRPDLEQALRDLRDRETETDAADEDAWLARASTRT